MNLCINDILECMEEVKICDYSDYDYKNEFWDKANRKYEHKLEVRVVSDLLEKYSSSFRNILDAGCGFGRLAPAYKDKFQECYMVDFAENLLSQAEKSLEPKDKFKFYKQSLYDLKIDKNVDAIISIRTLHHLNEVNKLFKRYYEALTINGILILDIPNFYHLKNKIKSKNKKREQMIQLSETFYNYDPNFIIENLKKTGFNILSFRQLGLFRVNLLKKYIPATLLVNTEICLNNFIKQSHIAPSVYVVAKKCG